MTSKLDVAPPHSLPVQGPLSRWIQFTQANQTTLRDHQKEGEQMQRRLLGLFTAVVDPDAELRQQVRSLLGLVAVYLANLTLVSGMLPTFSIRAASEDFRAAAMEVARELVGER
ncbi:MAG: hypothetical protein ACLQGJ_01345 [Candidatus Dormibacteria bacterium]